MKLPNIVFIHIMKTGGTTLKKILKNTYGKSYVLDRRAWGKTEEGVIKFLDDANYPTNYNKYKAIHGHFKYDRYKHLKHHKISIIRNPIDRIISEYTNLIKRESFDMSIYDYTKTFRRNIQYIMIGGCLDNLSFVGLTEKYDDTLKRFGDFLGIKIGKQRPLNVSKKKYIPTKKEIDVMMKLNDLDMKIYNQVLEIYK